MFPTNVITVAYLKRSMPFPSNLLNLRESDNRQLEHFTNLP